MRQEHRSRSQTQDVHSALRADILACRLPPGAKLKIKDLCDDKGVSPGAVREALSRLTAEGLVVAEAQRGFRISPVSTAELADLAQTRIDIEFLCLERAMARGTVEWEARVVAAYHRLQRTPERASEAHECTSEEWEVAHAAFHEALVSACGSPWLMRLRAMLYAQAERYRRLSVRYDRDERDVEGEHRELMQAVLDRDPVRAKACLAEHIGTTARIILEAMADEAAAPFRPHGPDDAIRAQA